MLANLKNEEKKNGEGYRVAAQLKMTMMILSSVVASPHRGPGTCPRHGGPALEQAGQQQQSNGTRVKDTKEIMKKRRERAICIVSAILF